MIPNVTLQAHIRTLSGRALETILSLRFFIFQFGIVYKLDIQGNNTSLSVTDPFRSCILYVTFSLILPRK